MRGALQEFLFKFSRNKLAEGLVDIVVQGEASPEAMKSLGSQLRQILPEKWKGLVRDQIDPNFVAAAGGAFNARWMAAVMAQPGCTCCDPGFTLDENNKIVIGNDEHVEL